MYINLLKARACFLASCIAGTHSRHWQGESFHFTNYGCGGSRMRLTCTYIHYYVASFVWCGIFYMMGFFCIVWQSILHNLKFPFLAELLSSWWSWFARRFGIEWKLTELQNPVAEIFGDVWPTSSLFPAHYFLQHLLSWLVLMSSSSTSA